MSPQVHPHTSARRRAGPVGSYQLHRIIRFVNSIFGTFRFREEILGTTRANNPRTIWREPLAWNVIRRGHIGNCKQRNDRTAPCQGNMPKGRQQAWRHPTRLDHTQKHGSMDEPSSRFWVCPRPSMLHLTVVSSWLVDPNTGDRETVGKIRHEVPLSNGGIHHAG